MLKKILVTILLVNFNKSYSMDKFGGFFKNVGNFAKKVGNTAINLGTAAKNKFIKKDNKEVVVKNKEKDNNKEVKNKEKDNNKEVADKVNNKKVVDKVNNKKVVDKVNNKEVNNKKVVDKVNNKELVDKNNKVVNNEVVNNEENNKTKTLELAIKDIKNYKHYDKINEAFRTVLEKFKDHKINIEIDKDVKENSIKEKIIQVLGNEFNEDDIELHQGFLSNIKKFFSNIANIFSENNNFKSFTIKNLIITKEIDKIEKCLKELKCEIDEKNINNYKDNLKNFKDSIENLKNNKFYSDYCKELDEEYNVLSKKIYNFNNDHLCEDSKVKLTKFKNDLNDKFKFIFNNEYINLNDNEKSEVKKIYFDNKFFDNELKKIKSNIETNDNYLLNNIDIEINEKKKHIQEHLKEFLTIIEFKIKDGKTLIKGYNEIFNDIVKEYEKGVFEYKSYENIRSIFDAKFTNSSKKFYIKENNEYHDITDKYGYLEKNKTNQIYVEFPDEFYIKTDEDDEEEEFEIHNEEEKGKGEDLLTDTTKKKKNCRCSKKDEEQNGQNKEQNEQNKEQNTKNKGCCGNKKR